MAEPTIREVLGMAEDVLMRVTVAPGWPEQRLDCDQSATLISGIDVSTA